MDNYINFNVSEDLYCYITDKEKIHSYNLAYEYDFQNKTIELASYNIGEDRISLCIKPHLNGLKSIGIYYCYKENEFNRYDEEGKKQLIKEMCQFTGSSLYLQDTSYNAYLKLRPYMVMELCFEYKKKSEEKTFSKINNIGQYIKKSEFGEKTFFNELLVSDVSELFMIFQQIYDEVF